MKLQTVVSEAGAEGSEVGAFLAHLPPDTPVYCYDDQNGLEVLPTSNAISDSFVVVKNLPLTAFDAYDEVLPGRSDYSAALQILILKMPSQPHEEAACSFEAEIVNLAKQMQVSRRLSKCGATRVDIPDRKKQADRSYKPAGQGRKWPTVAVEVGYLDPGAKLLKDITWWINGSRGEVKQGITIDIKKGSGNIEILSWVPAFPLLPTEVKVSSKGRNLFTKSIDQLPLPRNDQKIVIKRGKNGSKHLVQGKGLTIPFAVMFLKEPGEKEHDFVLSNDVLLEDMAELIWKAMDDEEAIKKGH
jgi:hypothetical protein